MAASKPPAPSRPRAGVGEGRHASGGAVGGRKGPKRKGRAGLEAGAGISLLALLPEAAAAPRPALPCPLAVRGCRGCSDLGSGDGAGSEHRERGPRVSVSRAAEAVAIAAWGHPEPATLRLGRARGENQPGPRAGAPSLGCLRASLRRLGRFEPLHTHLGDFSGCTAWAAEDSDRSLEAKTLRSGPASGERARSQDAPGSDLGRL